ncbi:MAG: polysaccharide deacetylase family protein [Pseudomonas sp.]|uniref:polysaccharide deacetylase family protein n=1 Tax=Pseudomonas sp. TaxID=306 RepID=UPI0033946A4E
MLLGGCASAPPASLPPASAIPVRFLLSFDDGPSAALEGNPTRSILDDLARNPIQPGIKALFFVQTRAARAGASSVGQSLMRREQREGHLLGFHTATASHSNHRFLSPQALDDSLQGGVADLGAVLGEPPRLVRPPFWSYDRHTFEAYRRHGLSVLLTDLSANDGKIWGFNGSPRRRSNLRAQLLQVRERILAGELPVVAGEIPLVATFHDLNSYTARHLQEYLQILLEEAHQAGLTTAAIPFYDNRVALQRAALARTLRDPSQPSELPGLWNWLWR